MSEQQNIEFHTHIKRVKKHIYDKKHLSPTQIILIGFAALILIGSLLLMLPISSKSGQLTPFPDALFTATSATCVTGLIVRDTGTYFSIFGQIVILTLIQIGGLGFMTMAIMMSMFIKRQITPRERLLVSQSLGLSSVGGTVKLVKRILIGTFSVEAIGAAVLATQFIPDVGVVKGLYYGIFHSISAFCNAGFDILDGTGGYGGGFSSMTGLHDNHVVGITIMLLVVIGGIGFIVWDDIVNFITEKKRFSVYSKFILTLAISLIIGGALILLVCEWNNTSTIGSMPLSDKIYHCLFQSVTTRTAGIDMMNNAAMTEPSKLISMLLMLIGGASGSTAGGIKMGTFGILLLATISVLRGQNEVIIGKRAISKETVIRALSVFIIDLAAVLITAMLISVIGGFGMIDSLYESVSGIATVGLSLGLTPKLPMICRLAVILLMFFGRVGVITITYSFLLKHSKKRNLIDYPDINMMVG